MYIVGARSINKHTHICRHEIYLSRDHGVWEMKPDWYVNAINSNNYMLLTLFRYTSTRDDEEENA